MFDIGFAELLLLGIVGLIIIGPERLPETARTIGLWIGRMRRMFSAAKVELERELGVDEVRRQLHNEQVMSELKALEQENANNKEVQKEEVYEPNSQAEFDILSGNIPDNQNTPDENTPEDQSTTNSASAAPTADMTTAETTTADTTDRATAPTESEPQQPSTTKLPFGITDSDHSKTDPSKTS